MFSFWSVRVGSECHVDFVWDVLGGKGCESDEGFVAAELEARNGGEEGDEVFSWIAEGSLEDAMGCVEEFVTGVVDADVVVFDHNSGWGDGWRHAALWWGWDIGGVGVENGVVGGPFLWWEGWAGAGGSVRDECGFAQGDEDLAGFKGDAGFGAGVEE